MAGTPFHNQVAMDNFPQSDWHFTANLAAGITAADEGKALTIDTSAANTYKLAGDTDVVLARLQKVEDRDATGQLLGLVALKFIEALPIKSGQTVVVGGSVQGAGNGEVKPLTLNAALNYVVEIRGAFAIVVKP